MNTFIISRPDKSEYQSYYETYISLVPGGNIISLMKDQLRDLIKFFEQINEDKSLHRYAEGKWSIREILGHLIDGEQIFTYRALRIARDDEASLPGYDENLFVENAHFDRLSFTSLIELFILTRKFSIGVYNSFDEESLLKRGVVDNKPLSVRAIPYVITGHVTHHLKVIEERYL